MIGAEAFGDPGRLVTGLNEINRVREGDLMFVDHPKYYDKALNSAATTILIDKKVDPPGGKSIIVSADPCSDYNRLIGMFMPRRGFSGKADAIGKDTEIH